MKLKLTANGIADYFNSMLERTKLVTGWLNRVAYPKILKAQKVRWQTAGASEGNPWTEISPSYRKSKLKKFAEFPGGGSKLLVATGRLAYSLTLDQSLQSPKSRASDHAKMVKGNELIIESFVPYGQYVQDQGRDISTLGEETVAELADGLRDYIVNGSSPGFR